ncbi:NnrS family protein [Sulfuritalea sp.]|uniref:NnrS family protein n=1 Tax=Sulfuritalea sp. TaxID=2480090 RepID=UPI001ACB782D|nr:NnrS family protein [Sulfuritalea sp.]MBN8475469.1 NnrS family protein [Sulfuritalea sp.]
MDFLAHPLWLVGFRPFFALACLAGLSLPMLWVLVHLGHVPAAALPVAPLQWHAHEMFFGFGWAVLGGFLLTSTKNWVGIRGYHGASLVILVAAWLFERAGMWLGGSWPGWLFRLSCLGFLAAIVAMLLWTLVRHHKDDSYRDNYFFLLILPTFLVAKFQMLDAGQFQAGIAMATGLFRVAFLVMLERTLTQFMKNIYQVDILRHAGLDRAIKLLGLILVGAGWMPPPLAAGLSLALALLLAGRLAFWQPQLALRRIDLGIMYLGYAAIVLQLVVEFVAVAAPPNWIGAFSTHMFGLGVMGLVIPAMLIRIAKGHTGRKVVFEPVDRGVLWIMIGAFLLRVLAPQLLPASYALWLALAAGGWLAGFGILAWRLIPFLLQPRVDGKEH